MDTLKKLNELLKGTEQGPAYTFKAIDKLNMEVELTIETYNSDHSGRMLVVRGVTGEAFNVEKVTKTKMRCFTFDIMAQRTSWNFPLEDIKLEKIEER